MRIAHRSLLAAAALLSLSLLCAPCGAAQGNLGTFKVNGKDASLGYAGLVAMEPVDGLPRMVLVLAEKAPAQGADAAAASDSGTLGPTISAPILKYADKGWSAPAGFSFLHPAAKNGHGWCAGDNCILKDVVVKDGEFRAHLVSTAPPATSGDTLAFDLNLRIKMP